MMLLRRNYEKIKVNPNHHACAEKEQLVHNKWRISKSKLKLCILPMQWRQKRFNTSQRMGFRRNKDLKQVAIGDIAPYTIHLRINSLMTVSGPKS